MIKFIQKELRRYFFMGKHKKWTLEDKVKIVKKFKQGATINYLNHKLIIRYKHIKLLNAQRKGYQFQEQKKRTL